MVRAGVVSHPSEWAHGGYREIQNPPERYRIIDTSALMKYGDVATLEELQNQHRDWVEDELLSDSSRMEDRWTQSIAVGSESFIEQVHRALGIKGKHRDIIEDGNSCFIKESTVPYNVHFATKIDLLRVGNTIKWDI